MDHPLSARPDPVDPRDRVCYQISVPNSRAHRAAFFGALLNLASAYNWADDPTHAARDVAILWRDIIDNVQICPAPLPMGGAGGDDDNMIRQNPDNPCELQTSINGIDWCTFADFSLCLPEPAQPGGGTPQPSSGGGQECYQGEMAANSKWLLPAPVSSGDVLDLTNATGAGNDGTISPWQCPDGSTYFGGICIPATGGVSGGDPEPSVYHMRLLYVIAGNYYDAMAGPFTVPGGITGEQVEVQVNDDVISDNAGSYRFKVCVTNNQAGSFSHLFDFTIGSGGFMPISHGAPCGVYVPGVGWQSVFDPDGGSQDNELRLAQTGLPSSEFVTASDIYSSPASINANAAGTWDGVSFGAQFDPIAPLTSGTNIHAVASAGSPFVSSSFRIDIVENVSNADNKITLSQLVVNGEGTDPF